MRVTRARAVTPVIATLFLIAGTLVLALVVGAYTFGLLGPQPRPQSNCTTETSIFTDNVNVNTVEIMNGNTTVSTRTFTMSFPDVPTWQYGYVSEDEVIIGCQVTQTVTVTSASAYLTVHHNFTTTTTVTEP